MASKSTWWTHNFRKVQQIVACMPLQQHFVTGSLHRFVEAIIDATPPTSSYILKEEKRPHPHKRELYKLVLKTNTHKKCWLQYILFLDILNEVGFYYSWSLHIFYSVLALEWNISVHKPEIHWLSKFMDGLHNLCTVQSGDWQLICRWVPIWKFID